MDKGHAPPAWGPADAVMSFQVLINVAFFCFGGRREDEGGWPIRRCDLIPARFDMWPIGLHVFALSLSFSPPPLSLTWCSPAHPHPHRWEMISGG